MNRFKKINTGVIGVGSMGQNHARIYSEISNLVAVSDPNKEQGLKIAKKFGAEWYENYEDMLSKVDAVSISVPTFLHKDIAEKVAAARVHILVEKPLASNKNEAERIIEISKKHNVVLGVGHVERHNPVVSTLESFIKNEDVGNILTLTARRFSNYPNRINDVGVLFDLTIHDVEIINKIANSKPVSVYTAGGKSRNGAYEDFINLIVTYENGIIGVCQTNWLTPMKVRDLSITTTKNFINLDFLKKRVDVMNSDYGQIDHSNLYETKIDFKTKSLPVKDVEPLKLELLDFLQAVKTNTLPLVSGQEGLNAVKVVEAGLESLTKKSIINV